MNSKNKRRVYNHEEKSMPRMEKLSLNLILMLRITLSGADNIQMEGEYEHRFIK